MLREQRLRLHHARYPGECRRDKVPAIVRRCVGPWRCCAGTPRCRRVSLRPGCREACPSCRTVRPATTAGPARCAACRAGSLFARCGGAPDRRERCRSLWPCVHLPSSCCIEDARGKVGIAPVVVYQARLSIRPVRGQCETPAFRHRPSAPSARTGAESVASIPRLSCCGPVPTGFHQAVPAPIALQPEMVVVRTVRKTWSPTVYAKQGNGWPRCRLARTGETSPTSHVDPGHRGCWQVARQLSRCARVAWRDRLCLNASAGRSVEN